MMDDDRRRLLLMLPSGAAAAAIAGSASGATPRPARSLKVTDFGATGDGITDDTEAFNRATRADAAWSEALECNILVPAGRYRIDGTVYVRKGQTLSGEGHASFIDASRARGKSFVLGEGRAAGAGKPDPGGSPVKISNLRTLGGSGSHGVVCTSAQGFVICDMFISAPGIGLQIDGADGLVYGIEIDQCLNAIVLSGAQNINISGVNIYLPNYGITFASSCRDIVISGCIFSYTRYCSILFYKEAERVTNILVTSCIFSNAVQYDTFDAFISIMSTAVEATLTGNAFRNWTGFAISQSSGRDVQLSMSGCDFDGSATNPVYANSVAANVLRTGVNGRFAFESCRFTNIHQQLVRAGRDPSTVSFNGGSVRNCGNTRISIAEPGSLRLSVKNLAGFATPTDSSRSSAIELPVWGRACVWRVLASGTVRDADGRRSAFVREAMFADPLMSAGDGRIVQPAQWKGALAQGTDQDAVTIVGQMVRPGTGSNQARASANPVEQSLRLTAQADQSSIEQIDWSVETAH